jgi:hypothetical protein
MWRRENDDRIQILVNHRSRDPITIIKDFNATSTSIVAARFGYPLLIGWGRLIHSIPSGLPVGFDRSPSYPS